jgi:formate hydrogenlyase subunit 3/multisubunit Na+/H+ antiporter MnhD subunit
MNVNTLLVLFPLLPFMAIIVSLLGKHALRQDVTKFAVIANSVLQILTGIMLIRHFANYEGLYSFQVSEWKYSIELSFDQYRAFFLAAFLVPSFLTIFHSKMLKDNNIRLIFLFYVGGCSGLIVAGDIFNFYIFYEVMIMAAYVLIAVNRNYFASIKYMMMGAISSAIFLAGIILLYASGSYFSYSFIEELHLYNPNNIQFIYVFFCVAFLIKGAFFPVSGWVATCHSATNSLVSTFLSSFTVFSGIMGLFYFVILPATNTGHHSILDFIGIVSLLTMLIPALILFFEPELKRCIAGSTVYTLGFIGLILSQGAYRLALTYLVIHSVYKSYMFLVFENLRIEKDKVYGSLSTLGVFVVSILFTVGFFPSLTYFVKYNFLGQFSAYKILTYIAMGLMLASFLKFRFYVEMIEIPKLYVMIFPLLITAAYLFFPFSYINPGMTLLFDIGLFLVVMTSARFIFAKMSFLSYLDSKYIYINLNYELLYIVVLFIAQIMVVVI